jgi:cytochrome c oxidase subunit II
MTMWRRSHVPLAVALAAFLVDCNGPQSIMHASGPAAQNISVIGWVVFILFGGVAAIMWGLLIWAALRKKGSLETHEPWDTGGGQRWILIYGFAIPFLVLAGVFSFAMVRMSDFPIGDGQASGHPEILVIGHQWWWEVRYIGGPPDTQFTTANEIHIPAGRPVEIQLQTADVIHSFWVPQLHGKVDMIPGQVNYIRIEANKPGRYPGECAEYCGAEHARMRLAVFAEPEQQFEAWKKEQLQPASLPTDPEAAHGEQVFLNAPCAFCHRIRGTLAGGLVGPDLTHLASRQAFAGDYYLTNKANLGGWVTHAQTMKPAAMMPNITEFNGPDLRALVAYLMQLK